MHPVVDVRLPGGLWHAGQRTVNAAVRPLCGHDQEYLLLEAPGLSAPARDTALLGRTVERLGVLQPPNPHVLDELAVGDRQVLLWTVRRETYGERLDLVVDCGKCQSKLDVSVNVTDLVTGAPTDGHPEREETMAGRRVRYRLPTGGDQAVIAGMADADGALIALVERLVPSVDGHPPTPSELDELAAPLSERLAEADPSAETVLEVACPDCGAETATVVDIGAILFEEALRDAQWLTEEVHTLAWHYHWSEHDILSLPVSRRRRYLELVEAAVAGPGG